ncbi:hypothetical protein KL939_001681 [Ogataea angusta]|nr:hypothetical protein KL939_001681 [Ogataea angusta]
MGKRSSGMLSKTGLKVRGSGGQRGSSNGLIRPIVGHIQTPEKFLDQHRPASLRYFFFLFPAGQNPRARLPGLGELLSAFFKVLARPSTPRNKRLAQGKTHGFLRPPIGCIVDLDSESPVAPTHVHAKKNRVNALCQGLRAKSDFAHPYIPDV